MNYPRLYNALNAYCRYVQDTLKRGVQVRTGSLQNSIKVKCVVNDVEWSMNINLNNYWKWLREPIPMDLIYTTAGLPNPRRYTRHPQESGLGRYPLDFRFWQGYLNDAYKQDVLLKVHNDLKRSGLLVGQ